MRAVRWGLVIVLVPLALLGLALAPASGLLTLPFAMMTGGLAFVFAQEARGKERSRTASTVSLVGLALTLLMLGVALVAG